MGKTPDVGFLSDTEQSTYFLKSIHEPALVSQAQSLLVSIINENQMQPIKMRGRAPLPTHLKIMALSETLAQTIQPLENELGFAPTANHMQFQMPFGQMMLPNSAFGMGQISPPYQAPYYGSTGTYTTMSPPYDATINQHIMQGAEDGWDATANWTERKKGSRRKETKEAAPRDNSKSTDKPTKPKVTCQACFMQGHDAINCWALARALLTQTFVRQLVDKSLLDKVKENYKLRFQPPENPRANKMCHDTLWSYCVDNKVTPEQVCHQLNWKGFADSRNDTDFESDEDDSSSTDERDGADKM
jgi:hypothetical protein